MPYKLHMDGIKQRFELLKFSLMPKVLFKKTTFDKITQVDSKKLLQNIIYSKEYYLNVSVSHS